MMKHGVKKMNSEMANAVGNLITTMINDYVAFQASSWKRNDISNKILDEQLQNYKDGFEINTGSKYIKISNRGSVKLFIINNENDAKFKYGDILKAASWAAPARNFSRGNVFGEYKVRWTGA